MNPHEDAELLATPRFQVVRRSRKLPDGAPHSREIILHPGAVTILPLVDDDHVVLIRNFRLAVDQTLLELPAGTLSPGEDPWEAARRELREETGYLTGRLEFVQAFWMSPGILQERMHLFVASDLRPGPPSPEVGEQIEPLVVPWSEAMAWFREGRIEDAKTLLGLLWHDRRRAS